ncbi:hypothetical protein Q3G72_031082 [Acer saccharum]|nr:hypothetical protein Q3G72_031082 [Acer saccharum]
MNDEVFSYFSLTKKRGYDVKVYESAVRGEDRHRGPIKLSSSALADDENVAKQIMEAGCVTGDRINGLADGISGECQTGMQSLWPNVDGRGKRLCSLLRLHINPQMLHGFSN